MNKSNNNSMIIQFDHHLKNDILYLKYLIENCLEYIDSVISLINI